jgi:hypothetical protein
MNEFDDREALCEILSQMAVRPFESAEPSAEWLETLTAWLVDDHEKHGTDDAKFADAIQLTWSVGSRLESELCGRFKKIVPAPSTAFPYVDDDGELQGAIIMSTKLNVLSHDVREIVCALAAEILNADLSHDTLFIHTLIRKNPTSYSTQFTTGKTA